jgi:hypothetical protein
MRQDRDRFSKNQLTNHSNDWTDALTRHAAASKAFADTARAINGESWFRPLAEGKWSPGQVVEHLNKTYLVVIDQLRGGKGIRIRSPWLLRQLLRQTVLRSIYRKRRLPKGARAPSEIVPKGEGEQGESVDRFSRLAEEFEQVALASHATGRKLTHHIFGEIDLLPGVDFIAIHIAHHHRQITGR